MILSKDPAFLPRFPLTYASSPLNLTTTSINVLPPVRLTIDKPVAPPHLSTTRSAASAKRFLEPLTQFEGAPRPYPDPHDARMEKVREDLCALPLHRDILSSLAPTTGLQKLHTELAKQCLGTRIKFTTQNGGGGRRPLDKPLAGFDTKPPGKSDLYMSVDWHQSEASACSTAAAHASRAARFSGA